MEIPAYFDIDYENGTEFYNAYNAVTPQFKNGNFPMNFVVGAHVIGAGSKSDIATALGQIIAAEKAANPAYSNFNTLSNYINGIRSATITASVSGNTTTVEVVNEKPITNFTTKIALGNITSATCDGLAIPSSQIKQDVFTSSWYVTQTIDAGTHVFVINGSLNPVEPILPVANFSTNVTSGDVPLDVQFTSLSTNADNLEWNFGDSSSNVSVPDPEHVFTSTGLFNVVLTASNGNGSDSKSN